MQPPTIHREADYGDLLKRLVATWDRCIGYAGDQGLAVAWEFEPGFAFNRPSDIQRVLDKLQHDKFGVLYDTANGQTVAEEGRGQEGKPETLKGGQLELIARLSGPDQPHPPDRQPTTPATRTRTAATRPARMPPFGEGRARLRRAGAALAKEKIGHDWWTVDLCFWPDAWRATAKCKTALDGLVAKYGSWEPPCGWASTSCSGPPTSPTSTTRSSRTSSDRLRRRRGAAVRGRAGALPGHRQRRARGGAGGTGVTVLPDAAHARSAPTRPLAPGALDRLRWAVRLPACLRRQVLAGPFHQPLGVFTGEPPTAAERDRLVEVHIQAADYAPGPGIELSIEPLNRFECYVLNTVADAPRSCARVGRPNYGLLYDTFHANIEEKDPIGVIAAASCAQINHVHISENDRGTPGKGHVPFETTFAALKEGGYDGWLSIEAFGRALPALAAATRVWRDFFPHREEVYRHGHDFLREAWAKA